MGDFFGGVLVGALIGIIGMLIYRKVTATPQARPQPVVEERRVSMDELLGGAAEDHSDELRQNLLLKFMYDDEKVDRAIAYERERQPQASLEAHLKAAIERWERDNR